MERLKSPTLDEMITQARGGYGRSRHCIGSDLNFISNSYIFENLGLLQRDLCKKDLKQIGERVKAIRDEDFRNSLFFVGHTLISELFDKDIGDYDNPRFKKIDNQVDFLLKLALRPHTGRKLNPKTDDGIKSIRRDYSMGRSSSNEILKKAYKPLNMILIDGNDFGFNGIATMRAKTDASLVLKQIRNYSLIFDPSEGDIDNASQILEEDLSSMDFTNHVFKYLFDLYGLGSDIHIAHEKLLENEDKNARAFGELGMKAHLFDSIGLKLSSNHEIISTLVKRLNKDKKLGNTLRMYQSRCKDNFGKSGKDGSAVFALNGFHDRVNLELRLQTSTDNIEAEFGTEIYDETTQRYVVGIESHYDFEEKKQKMAIDALKSGPEANMILAHTCYALGTTPADVIDDSEALSNLINEYSFYDDFGFDESAMKRRFDVLGNQREEYFKNLD